MNKATMAGFLLAISTGLVLAADAAKVDAPSPKDTIPVISAELKASFWKSAADMTTAQANLDKSKAAFDTNIQALRDACGVKFNLAQDGNRDPVCLEKPVEKDSKGGK